MINSDQDCRQTEAIKVRPYKKGETNTYVDLDLLRRSAKKEHCDRMVSVPNDKHTCTNKSQKLVNSDSTFSLDEHERPFHLISLFHSITISASQSVCPALVIYFASSSPSHAVSQTPLTQVHTVLPRLFSISPVVHFLSPALNFSPFILFDFPHLISSACWDPFR